MATLSSNVLTLTDWAKRLDPDGKVANIIEMLVQTNEILMDMPFKEGNLPTGHRLTVRTGLPAIVWRLFNQGVAPTKSRTAQVDEQTGMMEAYSEVDKDLAMLNGNTAEFRLSEAAAYIEAMNQEMSQTLFYGNSGTAPEEFTGLAPRYSSLSANNGQNIVDGGGSGSDNTSVWLVCWSENTACGIFPKGSQQGLNHQNLGEVTVETTAGVGGSRMQAYRDHWQWKVGLALKDWRYAVRLANVDVSDLAGGSPPNLITLMIKMIHRIPNPNMGRCAFYANRTVRQYLDIQAQDKSNVYLTAGEEEGRPKLTFRGYPVRLCDSILETEAAVT